MRYWTYPKRLTKPKASMMIPVNGHPIRTRAMPTKKHAEPFHLRLMKKKRTERCIPMIMATPERNITFPIARRRLSNNSKTPRKVNAKPIDVNPIPISFHTQHVQTQTHIEEFYPVCTITKVRSSHNNASPVARRDYRVRSNKQRDRSVQTFGSKKVLRDVE